MAPTIPMTKQAIEGLQAESSPLAKLAEKTELSKETDASLDKINNLNLQNSRDKLSEEGNVEPNQSEHEKPDGLDSDLDKSENSTFQEDFNPDVSIDKIINENSEPKTPNTYYCPLEGSNGNWEGERGNSAWKPNSDIVPSKNNPDSKTWGEIQKDYGIDKIQFKDGEPNFSDVSKGEVKLDEKETDRSIVFNESDIKLAQERGCSPSEVRAWRKENGYTWHEKCDGITTQKVPSIIHGNISHFGGHAANINTL